METSSTSRRYSRCTNLKARGAEPAGTLWYVNNGFRHGIVICALLTASGHPRDREVAPHEITSYLRSQKERGPDRERNWPSVLHRLEQRGFPVPDYQVGHLYHNDQIFLDMDDSPIVDYVDLPAALSTDSVANIWRTLPASILGSVSMTSEPACQDHVGSDEMVEPFRPSYSLSAIGMRRARFRQDNGSVAWRIRQGSQNIQYSLINQVPEGNIKSKLTRGVLPRNLLEHKSILFVPVDGAVKKTRGKRDAKNFHPSGRAGSRTLTRSIWVKPEFFSPNPIYRQGPEIQVGTERKRARKTRLLTSKLESMKKERNQQRALLTFILRLSGLQ